MKIIAGHGHMDLDSLGSLAMAQLLFPEHKAVKSRLSHPVALNVYNVYKDYLKFLPHHSLKREKIDHLIIVDARTRYRMKEIFDTIDGYPELIDVYDHHQNEQCDIEKATLYEGFNGANSTQLVLMVEKQAIKPSPELATVALIAIFADTGNFSHDTVTEDDFKAAAFLMSQGANVGLVKRFLKPPVDNELEQLSQQALRLSEKHLILGHHIKFFYMELPKQTSGLSSIVDRVFEIDNPEALFGCFGLKENNQILVVARSLKRSVNVLSILRPYGGGGHVLSSSVTLKKRLGSDIIQDLIHELRNNLEPELCASDIMDKNVRYIEEHWDLYRASHFLEDEKMSGTAVINNKNQFVGALTLRNISLARKNNDMTKPVKGYMDVNTVTCSPTLSVGEVENIFFSQAIGRLPVLNSDKTILGLITRERYLEFLETNRSSNGNEEP